MTRLASEIEKIIFAFDQIFDRMGVANIRDVCQNSIPDVFDIEWIAAVLGNQAVDNGYLGAEIHQLPGQIGSNESHSPGDQYLRSRKRVIHNKSVRYRIPRPSVGCRNSFECGHPSCFASMKPSKRKS